MAVGTKFTGLTAVALPAVYVGLRWVGQRKVLEHGFFHKSWRTLGSMILGFCGIYLLGWFLHFELQTLPGPGDKFLRPTGAFWQDLFAMHKMMFSRNLSISVQHNYASPWWTWPVMYRSIYYWVDGRNHIYLLGNPVVWWGSFLGFITGASLTLAAQGRHRTWAHVDPKKKCWHLFIFDRLFWSAHSLYAHYSATIPLSLFPAANFYDFVFGHVARSVWLDQ